MNDRALQALATAINKDFAANSLQHWKTWKTFAYLGPIIDGVQPAPFRECGTVYVPPALVEALGDLAEPLFAVGSRWDTPVEIIVAIRMLCRTDNMVRILCRTSFRKRTTRIEDLRVFLDWAETAVMEALLDG